MGQLYGTRPQLVNTLRQSILQLETSLPSIFMHTNWNLMRKPWIQALNTSATPKDFARALTVLQCCIKPCLMVNVWYVNSVCLFEFFDIISDYKMFVSRVKSSPSLGNRNRKA